MPPRRSICSGFKDLHATRVALGEIRELVVGDHIARIQILQRIRADEHRHVGKLLDEIDVVHVLIDDDLAGAQEQRRHRFAAAPESSSPPDRPWDCTPA